jgi:hypothetical protein
MVKIKYGSNAQNIKEVEVKPPTTDILITFIMNFLEKEAIARPVQILRQHQQARNTGYKPFDPSFKKSPKTKKVW